MQRWPCLWSIKLKTVMVFHTARVKIWTVAVKNLASYLFWRRNFWTARRLNFRTVKMFPCERNTWMYEIQSVGNFSGDLWTYFTCTTSPFMKERWCNILSSYFNTIQLDCFVFHLGKTVEDVKATGALICCSFSFIVMMSAFSAVWTCAFQFNEQCASSATHIHR